MKKTIPLILVCLSATLSAQQIAPGAYLGQGNSAADRAIDNIRHQAEENARIQAEARERARQQQIDDQQRQIDNIRRRQQP